MSQPIQVRINVSKILKEWLYSGQNGKYLNVVLFEKKEGEDRYGNHFSVKQDIPREARDRGVEAPFLGDAKWVGQPRQQEPQPRQGYSQRPQTASVGADDHDDEIPF